jgi:hypothetical protein
LCPQAQLQQHALALLPFLLHLRLLSLLLLLLQVQGQRCCVLLAVWI